MKKKVHRGVAVIDYGSGNLFSVRRALEVCGQEDITITADPEVIASSDRVILPGVGAFKDAMDGLQSRSLDEAIKYFASTGKPFLGICVGMQVLASEGCEGGVNKGLGIIDGRVEKLSRNAPNGAARKIPFIGWSGLKRSKTDESSSSILENIADDEPVYFLHSYQFVTTQEENRLAVYDLDGECVTAAVRRGNIFGTQFHPEKSRATGLSIVSTFLKI